MYNKTVRIQRDDKIGFSKEELIERGKRDFIEYLVILACASISSIIICYFLCL